MKIHQIRFDKPGCHWGFSQKQEGCFPAAGLVFAVPVAAGLVAARGIVAE